MDPEAAPLDDGRYDAFIVWVEERADGRYALEITITSGAHRGEVATVVSGALWSRDPFDVVGLPCTLTVRDGSPSVSFD